MLRTDDGGASWIEIGDELDNEDGFHLNAITHIKDAGLFVVGEMGIMLRSADGGDSWESIVSPYEGSLFGVLPTRQAQSLVVYGLRGHLYRSEDFGDSWQEIKLSTRRVDAAAGAGWWCLAGRWTSAGGGPWRCDPQQQG